MESSLTARALPGRVPKGAAQCTCLDHFASSAHAIYTSPLSEFDPGRTSRDRFFGRSQPRLKGLAAKRSSSSLSGTAIGSCNSRSTSGGPTAPGSNHDSDQFRGDLRWGRQALGFEQAGFDHEGLVEIERHYSLASGLEPTSCGSLSTKPTNPSRPS